LDALIFDFDGVVIDSEPIHFGCFRQVLASAGVRLTREAYYADYLGYDDHDCFAAAGRDNGVEFSEARIAEMTAAKTVLVQQAYAGSVAPLDGAAELIRSAVAADVPVAVCSGALREEIVLASRALGVLDCFAQIVAAEDVRRGKPDPEGYRLVLRRLAESPGRSAAPGRCVVVEDSPAGVEAARAAGMRVLAVTNSYAAGALAAADRVVASLAQVDLAALEELVDSS